MSLYGDAGRTPWSGTATGGNDTLYSEGGTDVLYGDAGLSVAVFTVAGAATAVGHDLLYGDAVPTISSTERHPASTL